MESSCSNTEGATARTQLSLMINNFGEEGPGVVKFLVLHNITVLTYQVCTVLVISYKVDSSFVDLESGSYPLST